MTDKTIEERIREAAVTHQKDVSNSIWNTGHSFTCGAHFGMQLQLELVESAAISAIPAPMGMEGIMGEIADSHYDELACMFCKKCKLSGVYCECEDPCFENECAQCTCMNKTPSTVGDTSTDGEEV